MTKPIESVVSSLVERVIHIEHDLPSDCGSWVSRNWKLGLQAIDDCGGTSETDAMADLIGSLIDLAEEDAAELDRLRLLFRTMRRRWFETELLSNPHEREWEDAEAELLRIRDNQELERRYNKQTEAILAGEQHHLTPTCGADLERKP